MTFIPTKIHGFLDYGTGILLMLLSPILNYRFSASESIILFTCAGLVLINAIITRFELGVFRVISVRAHLTADILAGAFLVTSPVLFKFSESVAVPHTLLGLVITVAAYFTKTVTGQGYTSRYILKQ